MSINKLTTKDMIFTSPKMSLVRDLTTAVKETLFFTPVIWSHEFRLLEAINKHLIDLSLEPVGLDDLNALLEAKGLEYYHDGDSGIWTGIGAYEDYNIEMIAILEGTFGDIPCKCKD